MYEQSEINYVDGDIVWVKLKSYWWPGQVIDLEKLSEDIQNEFKKKSLIAIVKFFQEDSFEFVKNYQQIYKYNCSRKDEFIKKGLDKYRIKNKDGSNFMEKFPDDVQIAETLTGGNPHLLLDDKFSPEKKPDISSLFGDKKISKKKRVREEIVKKHNIKVKVVHPRFLKENDHEIRIRQQSKNLSTTSSNNSLNEIYPCYVCDFTSTRVNVIICHLKNHRLNKDTTTSRLKKCTNQKLKRVSTNISKKKYIKQSIVCKSVNEDVKADIKKRKCSQDFDSLNKKKKSDPALREKLLADWNVDSDEDESLNSKMSLSSDSINVSRSDPLYENSIISNECSIEEFKDKHSDSNELLKKTNELLLETNDCIQFPALIQVSKKFEKPDTLSLKNDKEFFPFKKLKGEKSSNKNDDKKSLLSCFDFDEEDTIDSNISSVRKLPRSGGCKNLSIKKEIIKEFEKSQALQNNLSTSKSSNTAIKKKKLSEIHNEDLESNLDSKDSKDICKSESVNENHASNKNYEKQVEIIEDYKKIIEIPSSIKGENSDAEKVCKINLKDCKNNQEYYVNTYNTINKKVITEITQEEPIGSSQTEKFLNFEKNIENNACQETANQDQNKYISNVCDSMMLEYTKTNYENCQRTTMQEPPTEIENKINELASFDSFNKNDVSINKTLEIQDHTKFSSQSTFNSKIAKDSESKVDDLYQNKEVKYKTIQTLPSAGNHENVKMNTCLNTYTDNEFQLKLLDLNDDFNEKEYSKEDNFFSNSGSYDKEKNLNSLLKINDLIDNKDLLVNNVAFAKNSDVCIDNYKIDDTKSSFDEQNKVKQLNSVLHNNDEKFLLPSNETKCKKLEVFEIENTIDKSKTIDKKLCGLDNEANLVIKKDCVQESIHLQKEVLVNETSEVDLVLIQNIKEEKKENFKSESVDLILKDGDTSKNKLEVSNSNPVFIENDLQNLKSSNKNSHDKNINDVDLIRNSSIINHDNEENVKLKINFQIKSEKICDLNLEESAIRSKIILNEGSPLISDKIICNSVNPTEKVDELFKLTEPVTENKIVEVKKREKPRIIENVTLKEPMILKTKFVEKRGGKINKQKIGNFNFKLDDSRSKSFFKTKVMKIIKNNKNVTQVMNNSCSILIGKETKKTVSDTSARKSINTNENKKQFSSVSSPKSLNTCNTKKYVKRCENDINIDFDINSMPFVLSDDVLSRESIEQMPVVISSILPTLNTSSIASSPILTTPNKERSSNELLETFKEVNVPSAKKKSGFPTILKNKNKSKPLITSIKTIVPPLTSKIHKGGYKINVQPLTSSGNQKSPGKYVIVQSSGQHTLSTHQKVVIPANKKSSNAQIVQQGGKVVILTPPQSDQTGQSVLPYTSFSKVLNTENIHKFVKSKQIHKINTLNLQCPNSTLTSKNDQTNFILNKDQLTNKKVSIQQQTFSKSISKQIFEVKTPSITNPSNQIILSKESVSIPISTSILGEKIKSSKSTHDMQSQNISFSKDISTLIPSSISDQTIVSSQSIISKGTVLTPITGSQVRAIAAKNVKANKLEQKLCQNKELLLRKQKNPNISNSSTIIKGSLATNLSYNTLTSKQTNFNKKNINKSTKNVIPGLSLAHEIKLQEAYKEQVITEEIGHTFENIDQRTILYDNNGIVTIGESSKSNKLVNNKEIPLEKTTKLESQRKMFTTQNENFAKKNYDELNLKVSSNSNSSSSMTTNLKSGTAVGKNLMKKDTFGNITFNDETLSEKDSSSPISNQTQFMVLPTECNEDLQTYVFVTVNDQGHIIPLDNSSTISLNESLNSEGNETVYIDTSTLCESRNMDNVILHIDNNTLSNNTNYLESSLIPESIQTVENLPSAETSQTQSQDILAVALANTDFHQEVSTVETISPNNLTTFTETSLINQTILQSTIIPPTEPISSPLVLETSLTLNQPIMTPLEVPSNVSCQYDQPKSNSTAALVTTKSNKKFSCIFNEKSFTQNSNNFSSKIKEDKHESMTEKEIKKTHDVKCIDVTSGNLHESSIEFTQKSYKNNNIKKPDEAIISINSTNTDPTKKIMPIFTNFTDTRNDHILSSHNVILVEESEHQITDNKVIRLESDIILKSNTKLDDDTKVNKNNPQISQIVESGDIYKEHQKLGEHLLDDFEKNRKQGDRLLKYEQENKISTPIQSFTDLLSEGEEKKTTNDNLNSSHFSPQNYKIDKTEDIKDMENNSKISQELNDTTSDIINISMNNSIMNEDETVSSSYIPETPENQERDQDQESAISTSSYEIPPCEELNLISSDIISTSVDCEHSSIHNDGVLEIPTSSYSLHSDPSTDCGNEVPTSAYEDQIIIEPNVSSSYQVAISLPNFEETDISSNNFVCNPKNKDENTNFYSHSEITESYFESICKEPNHSRESKHDLIEKTGLQYYEDSPHNINSTSQDYFNQESVTNFNNHNMSQNYYDSQTEAHVNQSFYSTTTDKADTHLVIQKHEHQNFLEKKENDQQQIIDRETTMDYSDRYS